MFNMSSPPGEEQRLDHQVLLGIILQRTLQARFEEIPIFAAFRNPIS
jgi:hypothetical protein